MSAERIPHMLNCERPLCQQELPAHTLLDGGICKGVLFESQRMSFTLLSNSKAIERLSFDALLFCSVSKQL